jgi:hypothetical protein
VTFVAVLPMRPKVTPSNPRSIEKPDSVVLESLQVSLIEVPEVAVAIKLEGATRVANERDGVTTDASRIRMRMH